MKKTLGVVILFSAALVGGLAFSQNPPAQPSPEKRIEKLEADLALASKRLDALAAESEAAKARLAAVVKHLEEQSQAAAALARALDDAEKAGFTYGINPESRHLLLRGWREQLATAQKGLPPLPADRVKAQAGR